MKHRIQGSGRLRKSATSSDPFAYDSTSEGELADELQHDEAVSMNTSTEDEDISDIDEPRIVRWEGDVEDEILGSHVQEDKGEGLSKPTQSSPNNDLSSLSFGSILKARHILDQARIENDSDSEDESDYLEEAVSDGNVDAQTLPQDKSELRKPQKRPHKHAPVEMTSKRPVTRRRQVVEVTKANYHDPRFTPLANDDVRQAFRKRYSFLEDLHKMELEALKENLERARNRLHSAPRDRREEWEAEVDRLERAYKRAESAVNTDRKEVLERQALELARKHEKEQRKAGKREWHMKKSARKELLLKARHDALAESGGRLAVRKAIEKRQKKISQKEKRQRPSLGGRGQGITDGRGMNKRRKVGM